MYGQAQVGFGDDAFKNFKIILDAYLKAYDKLIEVNGAKGISIKLEIIPSHNLDRITSDILQNYINSNFLP